MRACSCRTRSAATASSSATRTAPSLRDAASPAFARCTESCSASASQTPRILVPMDLSRGNSTASSHYVPSALDSIRVLAVLYN
jgi:hypothetical protein